MSHIEGDGIIEDIYYLLWRKDSPFNEKLNLRIPETVIFRKGRPMAWYFTTNEGTVLRKKQTSLVYPEILKKFTKGAQEGEIVAYFINVDEEKKLGRLLDKSYFGGPQAQKQNENNNDEPPCHNVEYFGLKEFINTFSDYKNFEGKTGILQRFIHPYGSNNELIQAIWSPRVCVFTKRVNLRRLNETRFDVYERALTFDGPDFYSKNVPLRGGYIPGKLRATCDNIVRHIAYISFEKVNIKRLVGYFKVDKDENVWFLWTSSIRISETSKVHKKISQFVDKPLCLEPCLQTNANIRHIKTNFASRPVKLQMTEECTVCAKKVSFVSLVPVLYRLLLGNDLILKKSEEHASQVRLLKQKKTYDLSDTKAKSIKKASIGVPFFIKKLHPEMTLKDFQNLKDKEHFLMMKTEVCEECYLIVSKEYEGGFPFKFNESNTKSAQTTARTSIRGGSSALNENDANENKSGTPELSSKRRGDTSSPEQDTVKEMSPFIQPNESKSFVTAVEEMRKKPEDAGNNKQKEYNIDSEPTYFSGAKMITTSTMYGTSATNKSSSFPKFLNRTSLNYSSQFLNKRNNESPDVNLEENKNDQSSTNLQKNLIKLLTKNRENQGYLRGIQSNDRLSVEAAYQLNSVKKSSKPQRTSTQNINKKGRILTTQKPPIKYRQENSSDRFDESDNYSEFDKILEKKSIQKNEPNSSYFSTNELPRMSHGTREPREASNNNNKEEVNGGRIKLKGYFAEFSPEAKLQDHLDQDIVLTMSNAGVRPFSSIQRSTTYKGNQIMSNNSSSHQMDTQGSTTINYPSRLGNSIHRSASARPASIKAKQKTSWNDKDIIRELEEKVDQMYGKFYQRNAAI